MLPERIEQKIDKTGPCWVWTAGCDAKGYGKARGFDGRWVYIHRLVWESVNGEIAPGLVIDHKCRNRRCCNPDHLRVVTRAVNAVENSAGACAQHKNKKNCPKCGGEYYFATYGRRRCRACDKARLSK